MFFVQQSSKNLCVLYKTKSVASNINHVIQNIYALKSSFLSASRRTYHFSNVLQSAKNNSQKPKLSPQEVTEILKHNEQTLQLREENEIGWGEAMVVPSMHAIASADSNQLASNTPIEDKLASSKCLLTTGFLFGVFDGHGGPECSQVVSKRLFDYIAASLLPRPELKRVVKEYEEGHRIKLTKVFNDTSEFIPELQKIYDTSLFKWCQHLLNSSAPDFSMEDALVNAFLQLDLDISNEVLENKGTSIFPTLLRVALTGSVACVAHIDGPHVHVAYAGDCGAVLGEAAEGPHGGWVAKRLTKDHNWENMEEARRVLNEHPEREKDTIIYNQRLLGTLMPFRAFGDVRFKWERELQLDVIQPVNAVDMSFLKHCHTPPYLTARPEVVYQRLRPQEKFLILGSDGLWESMNPLDVVTLVGEYMSGRHTLQPFKLPKRHVSLGEISRRLRKRQEGLRLKPTDTNACTHLIRHCLGSTEEGVDHIQLSHSLTLPPDVRRYFRDDISIHVIFFDTHFLRMCPVEL